MSQLNKMIVFGIQYELVKCEKRTAVKNAKVKYTNPNTVEMILKIKLKNDKKTD